MLHSYVYVMLLFAVLCVFKRIYGGVMFSDIGPYTTSTDQIIGEVDICDDMEIELDVTIQSGTFNLAGGYRQNLIHIGSNNYPRWGSLLVRQDQAVMIYSSDTNGNFPLVGETTPDKYSGTISPGSQWNFRLHNQASAARYRFWVNSNLIIDDARPPMEQSENKQNVRIGGVANGGKGDHIVRNIVITCHSPTPSPTFIPTLIPTLLPTFTPTLLPTFIPTASPTAMCQDYNKAMISNDGRDTTNDSFSEFARRFQWDVTENGTILYNTIMNNTVLYKQIESSKAPIKCTNNSDICYIPC
eukprot:82271_1